MAPLIWRRRFPLSTFAFVAVVALVQWIVNVRLAADVTLLVYLYTVASRYPVRVGILAAAVVEAGTVMVAIRWPLTHQLDRDVCPACPVQCWPASCWASACGTGEIPSAP